MEGQLLGYWEGQKPQQAGLSGEVRRDEFSQERIMALASAIQV